MIAFVCCLSPTQLSTPGGQRPTAVLFAPVYPETRHSTLQVMNALWILNEMAY